MGINDLTSTSHAESSRCIFFHWDGARYDQLTNLLKKRLLPNVEKYIISKGKYTMGITCFPSTTGPANLPYLAGTLPDHFLCDLDRGQSDEPFEGGHPVS